MTFNCQIANLTQVNLLGLCVCVVDMFFSLYLQLNQIDRLKVRLRVMQFMGNFEEDMAIMTPVSYNIVERRRER